MKKMTNDRLKELSEFWTNNGLSRTQWHYLRKIGRAPRTIVLGSKEMVAPEAEAAWRAEMTEKPLVGSLRKLAAEAAERAAAVSKEPDVAA
jgi:hypothetical protein